MIKEVTEPMQVGGGHDAKGWGGVPVQILTLLLIPSPLSPMSSFTNWRS